ncbi:MAG: penicillin acylase family protein [Promethearchaeota archaeon]
MAGGLASALLVAFSVPFGQIPPLGDLLFPGEGVWLAPGEVPASETIRVEGLSGEVQVFRDQWGVPHVYASSESDAVFALGYLHAQDRLFQMEMARRVTRGRLAEFYGPAAVATDLFSLSMMKEYWANETWKALVEGAKTDPELATIHQLLLNYTAGVNYYLGRHRRDLPAEFRLIDVEPAPWTPLDTLCFEKYMTEMLTWDYGDLERYLAMEALGAANYTELFASPTPYQVPVVPGYGDFPAPPAPSSSPSPSGSPPASNDGLVPLVRSFLEGINSLPLERSRLEAQEAQGLGSNNWATRKTGDGSAILANDMHLAWNLPGIWYEAHLVDASTGWNFYGFTLAGVPVPVVGHNDRVAWGFTNAGFDVLDWYFYDGINDTHYWYMGQPKAYGQVPIEIPVKGQATIRTTIKTTVEGPVLSGISGALNSLSEEATPGKVLAARWVAHNVTWDFRALYGFAHASNRAEFDAASRYFSAPAQNVAYADADGNVGIRPTGWYPLRDDPPGHPGNGTVPYNGSAGEGRWYAYLPFEELPHAENPAQGFVASANQISAGPAYPRHSTLQHSYAAGYRARRINELLAGDPVHTVEDMMAFHLDVGSERAEALTPYLVSALEGISQPTAAQASALAQLKSWNYNMDRDSAAPTIFHAWAEALADRTFSDEMGAAGVDLTPPANVLEYLVRERPNSKWFDDVTTSGVVEERDDVVLAAASEVVSALEAFFGTPDASQWKWGEVHERSFPHLLGIEPFGAGPFPGNGSGYTLNPAGASIWRDGEIKVGVSQWGASERMVVDFGNLSNCWSVIPSGQRGVTTSKHYSDQLDLFRQGLYHPQYFTATTPAAFQTSWVEATLTLKPGGG